MTPTRLLTPCLLLLAAGGCYTGGLPPRNGPAADPTALVYALYDGPQPTAAAAPMTLPAAIAVVQVGELAPPPSMLNSLRGGGDVFRRVESIPATDALRAAGLNRNADLSRDLTQMRRLAADMGMTHLLLFGGAIDAGAFGSPWEVLDATVIGAFVVPSRRVEARAKVSATLIDVAAGRAVLTASAEGRADEYATLNQLNDTRAKVSDRALSDAVAQLTSQTLGRARDYAASPPVAVAGPVVPPLPVVEDEPPARVAPAAPPADFWNRFGRSGD